MSNILESGSNDSYITFCVDRSLPECNTKINIFHVVSENGNGVLAHAFNPFFVLNCIYIIVGCVINPEILSNHWVKMLLTYKVLGWF